MPSSGSLQDSRSKAAFTPTKRSESTPELLELSVFLSLALDAALLRLMIVARSVSSRVLEVQVCEQNEYRRVKTVGGLLGQHSKNRQQLMATVPSVMKSGSSNKADLQTSTTSCNIIARDGASVRTTSKDN